MMAIKPFAVCLLIWITTVCYAQNGALLGLQFDHTTTIQDSEAAFGIELEGSFGKHFSLGYSVLFGPGDADQYYFYTGGGQALGVSLISKAIEEGSGLALAIPLGMASFVLPESVTFRFQLSENSQMGIFLAPYGYEILRDKNSDQKIRCISSEIGLKYYWSVSRTIVILPRIGVKAFYGEERRGATFGATVMFRVDKAS